VSLADGIHYQPGRLNGFRRYATRALAKFSNIRRRAASKRSAARLEVRAPGNTKKKKPKINPKKKPSHESNRFHHPQSVCRLSHVRARGRRESKLGRQLRAVSRKGRPRRHKNGKDIE